MSLTCLTCRTVFDPKEGLPVGNCPQCGSTLLSLREPWLRYTGPGGSGRARVFNGMSIGRLFDNDLVLEDREVSKHHAVLFRRGQGWYIRDSDSANGTFVNTQRVFESQLHEGDRLQLGATELVFRQSKSKAGASGITIVPTEQDEGTIQACLQCKPGDFKPVTQIESMQELREDYERLRIAYRFNRYMASERDSKALVENMLKLIFDLLPVDRGAILLREQDSSPLTLATTRHRGSKNDEIRISDSILSRAVTEKKAVLSADAMVDHRFHASQSIVSEGIRSAMCVPLVGQQDVLGAIHLDTLKATGAFSLKDLQLLTVLTHQAALLLERMHLNQRLDKEAQTRERLTRFLSPEVLQEVVERRLDLDNEGRLGQISVLFCDIRGFTTLAQSMNPNQLLKMLNGFFEHMVDVVFAYDGVLDKFIGDAIMAVWGAPIKRVDDADRAIRAGLDMLAAVSTFNRSVADRKWPALEVGIGVNSGEAVIGTVGSKRRMEYTVMGDTVNLASRICSIAGGNQMLLTSNTVDLVSLDDKPLRLKRLESVQVKGRVAPVEVYEALAVVKPELCQQSKG